VTPLEMCAQFIRQRWQDRHVAISPPFCMGEVNLRWIAIQKAILDRWDIWHVPGAERSARATSLLQRVVAPQTGTILCCPSIACGVECHT